MLTKFTGLLMPICPHNSLKKYCQLCVEPSIFILGPSNLYVIKLYLMIPKQNW